MQNNSDRNGLYNVTICQFLRCFALFTASEDVPRSRSFSYLPARLTLRFVAPPVREAVLDSPGHNLGALSALRGSVVFGCIGLGVVGVDFLLSRLRRPCEKEKKRA